MKTVGNGIGFFEGMADDQKKHMQFRLIMHNREQISRIQAFNLHHVRNTKRRCAPQTTK